MDPEATRTEMRELAHEVQRTADNETAELDPYVALRLAELVLALDEWLCHAGFPPAAWRWGGMGGE